MRRAGDLSAAPVVDGQGEDHAGVRLALGHAVLEHLARALGERTDVAEEHDPDVLPFEQGELVYEGLGEQVHEQVDLALGAVPVLGRERVGAQHVHAQAHTGGDDLAQGDDAGLVALGALHAAGCGPAAVPVHDAGDMARDARHIQILEPEALGGVGEVGGELGFVVPQG